MLQVLNALLQIPLQTKLCSVVFCQRNVRMQSFWEKYGDIMMVLNVDGLKPELKTKGPYLTRVAWCPVSMSLEATKSTSHVCRRFE